MSFGMIILNESINTMQNYANCRWCWKKFDSSNYEIKRPLPIEKNKKVVGLIKDELSGKITTRFVGVRPKKYSYLIDHGTDDKTAKWTKKMCNKTKT